MFKVSVYKQSTDEIGMNENIEAPSDLPKSGGRHACSSSKWLRRAVKKQYYEMPKFVGFQTMGF